jgi:hypothetical protein
MAEYMNRDLETQINMAKAIEKSVKTIEDEITAKRAILAKWADELDPGSLRAISKFEDEVSKLMVQLDEYKALAARLRMNGENLKDIIDSVHF